MSQRAIDLWQNGRHEAALDQFRREALNKSGNALVLLDYGSALLLTGQGRRAGEMFDKARAKAPAGAIDRAAADRFLAARRQDLALPFLERLVAEGRESADHRRALAECLERAGRLDEAQARLDDAERRDGASPALGWLRALLERRCGNHERALQRLDELATLIPADDPLAIRTHYARADCLDRLGRHCEMFPALEMAKAPLRAGAADIFAASRRALDLLAERSKQWSCDGLRAWRDEDRTSFCPALLTGFPRSGTTLLEVMLAAHEGSAVSSEVAVFSDFLVTPRCDPSTGEFPETVSPLVRRQLAKTYRDFHEGNTGPLRGRQLIDKNPALVPLLPLFLNVFPHARLLFCLRDPRDLLLSCHMQDLPLNKVSVWFLDWADGWEFYRRSMEIWLRLRDSLDGNFLEIRYEDTVADAAATARRALDFLDLPWSGRVADYQSQRRDREVFSPSYADVRQPVHNGRIGRWREYESHFNNDSVPTSHPLIEHLGYRNA